MTDPSTAEWRKSSYCASGTCVEVALLGGHVAVRDSKDRRGPLLYFSHSEWADFLDAARNGEFNSTAE